MLEIKPRDSNPFWRVLYSDGILISNSVAWDDTRQIFDVEDLVDKLPYSTISNLSLDELDYNIQIPLPDFDFTTGLMRVFYFSKIDQTIIVEFFADFFDLEKGRWKVRDFLEVAESVSNRFENLDCHYNFELEDLDCTSLIINVKLDCANNTIDEYVKKSMQIIQTVFTEIENELDGWEWNEEFSKNEKLFTYELVIPLMRKLGFKGLRYFHGINEYGKDVIAFKINEFGIKDYYAIQVKAGDISGSAKGSVDELINQIQDAFDMPFELINETTQNSISKMIVAISGKFTNNAQEKIKQKVRRSLLGNIVFLDKEDILDLLKR